MSMKKLTLHLLIIALLLLTLFNTYLILSDQGLLQVKINESISSHTQTAKKEAIEEIKLHIPQAVNGMDGVDGKDGKSIKGDKGDDGKDGVTEIIHTNKEIKEVVTEYVIPEIRCNEKKNRWETKHLGSWIILGGSPSKCTVTIKGNE